MLAKVIYPNRRRRQRYRWEFEVSLLHQIKGRTKDVSANGVSFDVITDDFDAFSPGTIIPLELTTFNITDDFKVKKLCLSGKGLIICREVIKKTTGCGTKLSIAVQFTKKLSFWVPSNN